MMMNRIKRARVDRDLHAAAERASVVTSDCVMLALRRYANPGARPVILLHGVFQNMNAWDLPLAGRSLARTLHARGLDVWLFNYRNHSDPRQRSGSCNERSSIDDLAIYDLPAVIGHVRRVTGLRPHLIGHSMGGVVALIYLMGAYRDEGGEVGLCEARAQARNALVGSLTTVGTPLPLRWQEEGGGVLSSLMTDLEVRGADPSKNQNRLYRALFGRRATLWLCNVLQTLPVASALGAPALLASSVPLAGRHTATLYERVAARIALSRCLVHLWEPQNLDSETVKAELTWALSDTPTAVLHQLCDWIRHGCMRSYLGRGTGNRAPCDYLAHLHRITTPTLMIVGERDRAANAQVAERSFADIGASRRRFVLLHGYGHNDLRVGHDAIEELCRRILPWLGLSRERSARRSQRKSA